VGRRGWPIRIRNDDNGCNALVTVARQHLQSCGQPFVLNQGMKVVAEIRQGETTVMEYLFSPVAVSLIQAGRAR
jgi:HlyD family secretion protein